MNAATQANGNIGNLNQNTTLPSTVQQMANYLASRGGAANPQALYVISSGANDVTFALDNFSTLSSRETYLANQAAALANAIRNIQMTGAQHILVNGLGGSGTLPTSYTQALFSDLSALGVNFIGADIKALVQAIQANPTLYGFTAATVLPGVPGTGTTSACVWTGGTTQTGWANGAPTRLRQVPNMHTLGPLPQSRRAYFPTISIFLRLAKRSRPPMISAS